MQIYRTGCNLMVDAEVLDPASIARALNPPAEEWTTAGQACAGINRHQGADEKAVLSMV